MHGIGKAVEEVLADPGQKAMFQGVVSEGSIIQIASRHTSLAMCVYDHLDDSARGLQGARTSPPVGHSKCAEQTASEPARHRGCWAPQPLSEHLRDDLTAHVRQPEVATQMPVGQSRVIEAEAM